MKNTLLITKVVLTLAVTTPLCIHSQSFRGLSLPNKKNIWVSGSGGEVRNSLNNGRTWKNISPLNFKNKDFRDIHAWNTKEAIIMSAGDSAVFLKTKDGGKHWYKVYANNLPGIFFDAIDFKGRFGVAIADPTAFVVVGPKSEIIIRPFYFIYTVDSGETWSQPAFYAFPHDSTEAMFAASGSIIHFNGFDEVNPLSNFVTGGNRPAFRSVEGRINISLPIQNGAGCGAYSMAQFGSCIVAVGGYWKSPNKSDSTCTFSLDSGKTWQVSTTMPSGYRSSVSFSKNGRIAACTGTNGTDVSFDKGKHWIKTDISGYNVCSFNSKYLILAGSKGSIAKYRIRKIGKKYKP